MTVGIVSITSALLQVVLMRVVRLSNSGAWAYVPSSKLEAALARLEDIISILWKLTHG